MTKEYLLNIYLAISNVLVILPLRTSYLNGDIITFSTIFFVGLMSFLSHLFENHKHGMKGFISVPININININCSYSLSYVLNRFDVLGCIFVLVRFLQLFYKYMYNYNEYVLNDINIIVMALFSLSLNLISEYDKTIKTRCRYVITHSLWHVCIYYVMDCFLIQYYEFMSL